MRPLCIEMALRKLSVQSPLFIWKVTFWLDAISKIFPPQQLVVLVCPIFKYAAVYCKCFFLIISLFRLLLNKKLPSTLV